MVEGLVQPGVGGIGGNSAQLDGGAVSDGAFWRLRTSPGPDSWHSHGYYGILAWIQTLLAQKPALGIVESASHSSPRL